MNSSPSQDHFLLSDYQLAFCTSNDHEERNYHSRIVDFYEENSDKARFAFVDETFLQPKVDKDRKVIHQGFYAMSAVIIEADKIKAARTILLEYAPNLDFKFHANKNSDSRNLKFLEKIHGILSSSTTIITVSTAVDYSPDDDTQATLVREARHSNMLSLIQQAQDRDDPVYAFVFERLDDPVKNELDREAISRFIRENRIKPIGRTQVSSRAEKLLWIADVVCYATQKVLRASEYTLYDRIKDYMEVYDAVTQRYLDLSPDPNRTISESKLKESEVYQPIGTLPNDLLRDVAYGRFIREEIKQNLSSKGNLKQPADQQGLAYQRVQEQGYSNLLSSNQAVDQSIARGRLTPIQMHAIEELERRGVSIPLEIQQLIK